MAEIVNQNPEQIARDKIDKRLAQAKWDVQSKDKINLSALKGVAVREYQPDAGFTDYVLFVDGKPVVIVDFQIKEFINSNNFVIKKINDRN